MATSYPQFGAQTGYIRSTQSDRSDQAELVMGKHTEVFVRSTRKECSVTKSDCSWGIEPAVIGGTTLILDTVRLTIDDEPDLNYTANQTGSPSITIPLTAAKCCIIRRARVSLTVDGKGNPGWAVGQGLPVGLSLASAIGTPAFSISDKVASLTTASWRLISFNVTDTDRDWQKFTAEFQGYIDALDGNSVALAHLDTGMAPPVCDCPEIGGSASGCCDSYRAEWSLNGEGYAEKTGTLTKNPRVPQV